MAQLINVKLSRFDAQPWGFRLQGGKDFGAPLLIQKVTGGSLAEKAGLQAGDAVIRINSTEVFNLRHKDAQDTIVRAGNNFEITLQRGGSTWKPAVAPIGAIPSINSAAPAGNIAPVTKTSLAARPQAAAPIASGHNVAAKPFGGAQVNGSLGDGTVKSIVNKQYNTPVGMYSEETIAETLSAQAEVLAGGVLGVNFKKNEKSYNPGNSEVLKLLQEIDNEPRESEPDTAPVPGSVTSPPVSGLRHVSAPETKSTKPSIALMWRGGCIIRSVFLKDITNAYRTNPDLENLLFDDFFKAAINKAQSGWRNVVSKAALWGIPNPAFSTALSFYDGYRTRDLPANLLQAQRDYFGAHTFRIKPEHANENYPEGKDIHVNWTGRGGDVSASTYVA